MEDFQDFVLIFSQNSLKLQKKKSKIQNGGDMNFLLVVAFLFFAGSLIGWGIELFWRRFFSKNNPEKKWINPGFLAGPYLPLYGFSLVILFSLSFIKVDFIENIYLQKAALFVLMAVSITFFEYVAGLIFIKGMKIKLWDYSSCWGNIQGIVCPLYTFFWLLLSATYYFFIHPHILSWLFWFTNHLTFSFFVGFFYGVFTIDVCYSLKVMRKILKFAKENEILVHLEKLKSQIRAKNDERKEKIHFWLAMKSEEIQLPESLRQIYEKLKSK